MKVICVVSVVLLITCAATGNPLSLLKESGDLDGNFVKQKRAENYEPVGCYSFGDLQKLNIFHKDEAYKKAKDTSGTPFDQCITEAMKNDYQIIGIQKIKKNIICRKGNEQQWKPDKLKKLDASKCEGNVGSKKTIFIYQKNQNPESSKQCIFEDKLYEEGGEAQTYHKTDNELNAFCRVCKCSQGQFACKNHICEVGYLRQMCPEVIHPPYSCCPICKPYKCNGRKEGQSWFELKNKKCVSCKCHYGDSASCKNENVLCPTVSCKDPVIPEGTCCPRCASTPPTKARFFTIELTTTRSPPDFPPGFHFRKKRDVVSRVEQFDGVEETDEMEQ